MYTKCIECPRLGVSCDGPNFAVLDANELMDWCKKRKNYLGITNAKLAELSGLPKGSIDRLFSVNQTDFKYETIRPLLKALVGGAWGFNPCGEGIVESDSNLQEELKELKEEDQARIDYMKGLLLHEQAVSKTRRNIIFILSIALDAALLMIIAALVVDRMTGLGFFWK